MPTSKPNKNTEPSLNNPNVPLSDVNSNVTTGELSRHPNGKFLKVKQKHNHA